MSSKHEVKLQLKNMLGAHTPYWQGGSLRILLPKKLARESTRSSKPIEEEAYVWVDTDHGYLLVPLVKFMQDESMRGLSFASLQGMTPDEIVRIINELVDEKEFE